MSGQTRAADEVEKFGSLSSEWWNQSGDFVVLKAMNKLRIPLIRDALLKGQPKPVIKPLASFRILDVGCGGGLLSEVASLDLFIYYSTLGMIFIMIFVCSKMGRL